MPVARYGFVTVLYLFEYFSPRLIRLVFSGADN